MTYPQAPMPPAKKPSTMKRNLFIGGGMVLALLIGVGIGSTSKAPATAAAADAVTTVTATQTVDGTTPEAATVTATITETPAAAAPVTVTAGPPPAQFKDGINLVGTDVQPGTYRSENPGCYFARLSATTGTLDDILANGNGAVVITIEPSDVAFQSSRCAPWTQVG